MRIIDARQPKWMDASGLHLVLCEGQAHDVEEGDFFFDCLMEVKTVGESKHDGEVALNFAVENIGLDHPGFGRIILTPESDVTFWRPVETTDDGEGPLDPATYREPADAPIKKTRDLHLGDTIAYTPQHGPQAGERRYETVVDSYPNGLIILGEDEAYQSEPDLFWSISK